MHCLHPLKTEAAHRKAPANRAIRPFQLIYSDSCTITTPSISGARYYLLFIDEFSRWAFVYFLNKRSAETCTHAFDEMIAYRETISNYKIQRFRCYNGIGEYDSKLFRKPSPTMEYPLNPPLPINNMNGVAERMIQTLNTTGRRCSPTTSLGGRTPYEVLPQIILTIHHL